MLDNIENIACLYVRSYARYHVCDSMIPPTFYGDVLELKQSYDNLYISRGTEWFDMMGDGYDDRDIDWYFRIWQINPSTGFFMFSDYWENDIKVNRLHHTASFNCSQYRNELIKNIRVASSTDLDFYEIYTYCTIAGFICKLYAYDYDSMFNEYLVNDFYTLIQNSDVLVGTPYTPEIYPDEGAINPLKFWIQV